MDAPPHSLCSVTIKSEPDETDMDLPFKTPMKTELGDFNGTVQELVPEFPMELKYSPPVDLSAQPFCSVTVKCEQEVHTDVSFKTLPRTEDDGLKTEIPDDTIGGNSSDGTSLNCASYSLSSSTGGVGENPPNRNLCTSKDEAIVPYICTHCGRRFSKVCQLRNHLHHDHQPRSGNTGFFCFECNKAYVKREEFMCHILEVHPRVCPICSETFRSCWDLHEHLSKYSRDNSCSCPRCYQVYPTITALEHHMLIKDYYCKLCNNKFSDCCKFNEHIKSHTQKVLTYDIRCKSHSETYAVAMQDPQLYCPKCEKKFTNRRALNNHLIVHAPQQKTFTCDFCNKTFFQRCLLLHHVVAHAGVRPFPCSMCKKRYKKLYKLRAHEKIHSKRGS